MSKITVKVGSRGMPLCASLTVYTCISNKNNCNFKCNSSNLQAR